MSTTIALSRGQMARLQELATEAVANVSRGLTGMFGSEIVMTALTIHAIPLAAVGGLLGDPEMEIAGVYLVSDGAVHGHLLLMMQLSTAMAMVDILLEQEPGSTVELNEMEISALGEMGNIVGSFFLNSIADNQHVRLTITPPGVICDMAGAVINLALMEVAMYADEALVIDANFEHQGRRLPAWFLAFPDPVQLQALLGTGGDR